MKFLPKSLGGVKGFRKNCLGGSTYFAFYCIFINKFFENLPAGVLFHTPLPPVPPLCASMHPLLSLTPPSLFPDKKFPVEAHFWLDKLFYYTDKLGYPCLACVQLFVSVFFSLSLSLSLPFFFFSFFFILCLCLLCLCLCLFSFFLCLCLFSFFIFLSLSFSFSLSLSSD